MNPSQRSADPTASRAEPLRDVSECHGMQLAFDSPFAAGFLLQRLVAKQAFERRNAGGRMPKVAALRKNGVEHEPVDRRHAVVARQACAGAVCADAGCAGASVSGFSGRSARSPRSPSLPVERSRLLFLHHRRRRSHRFVRGDDEVAQDGVVELECVLELGQRLRAAFDVHQDVVGLVDFLDRIGELPPSPVLQPVNPAARAGHHRAIPVDHRGHLLALIGMHDEYDFVMTHVREHSFRSFKASIPGLRVRQRPPLLRGG